MILKTLMEPFVFQIEVLKFSHTDIGDTSSLYINYFNKDYYTFLTVVPTKCNWYAIM